MSTFHPFGSGSHVPKGYEHWHDLRIQVEEIRVQKELRARGLLSPEEWIGRDQRQAQAEHDVEDLRPLARRMRGQGCSLAVIARMLKVHHRTLARLLREENP